MKNIFLICSLLILTTVWGQRGKDGNKVVTGTETVNAYTFLTTNANVGDTSITVNSSALNSNFIGNITSGDLVMIIQVQGVSIEDTTSTTNVFDDSRFHPTWGRITNYNNCGNYEFIQVESVPNGTTLNFDCGLTNNYTANGNVIIVRVPRYNTLTINPGGILTTTQWNGTSGGILAVEVLGVTTINASGKIDASELGFRGGIAYDPPSDISGSDRYADDDRVEGAEKGEGIAGDQIYYVNNYTGKFNRGAAANAGGGANAHNAGGGGGANAGNPNIWNNGVGNPDISSANYIQAWNMEDTITGLNATTISSGGGRGGYSFLQNDEDELNLPPGHTDWGSSKREAVGGLGGRPLDYTLGKIFMGGAGGAGEGNDDQAGDGGNAGGLVFLKTYNAISGDGDIISNGQDGGDSFGNAPAGQLAGKDGCGGGGAGGTIILQTTSTVSLTGQILANGGNGGNQILDIGSFYFGDLEAEGPGGSAGGGYIAITSGSPTTSTSAGINGTTTSAYVSNFPPNGATSGGEGITDIGTTLTFFDLTASDVAICPNTTANITANITGSAPAGITIEWYDAEFNGNLLQTGTNYTTPSLSSNTTYYVKTCPGDFSIPVNVTMSACGTSPVSNFSSSDSTLCLTNCISFNDLSTNTPTSWIWYFFGSDSLTSTQQNPTNICYNSTGYFPVALVSSNGSGSDSLYIDSFIVVTKPIVIANATDTTICSGDSIILFGSGSPVNNYSWLPAAITDSIIFSPSATQLYTLTGTDSNLCMSTDTITIHVNILPTVIASAIDTTLCLGDSTTLSGSGANTYIWDNSVIDGAIFAPTNTQLYTVTGTDNNLCENTDTLTIHVNSLPTVIANATDTIICSGDSIILSGSGANTYAWNNSVIDGVIFAPANTQLYTVTGTDNNLCQNTDTLTIHVTPLTTPTFTAVAPICTGDTLLPLATTSNDGYTGSWSPALDNTTTTTYTFTPDPGQCANTTTLDITVNSTPATPTFTPVAPICTDDTLLPLPTTSNDGYTGSWSPALDNTTTTTYTFTPDPGQCATISTMDVVVSSAITPTFTQLGPYCIGDTPDVLPTTSNNGIAGTWDAAISTTTVATVTYTFTPSGCATITTMDINVNDLPVVTATASNDTICLGESVVLSGNGALNYSWFNSLGAPQNTNISPSQSTVYFLQGTDINGCSNSDKIVIIVESCETLLPIEPIVIIPSVFTPNIDGYNDLFNISGVGITAIYYKIYNRWGEMIFETNQLNQGWNGRTTSGIEVPEGTYFYIATVTTINGEESHHGSITLIR